MDIERGKKFIETLSNDQILLFYSVLNFNINSITWDFDQVLVDTEYPVKEAFDEIAGTNYRKRKVDRFRALTAWSVEDGVFDRDIAQVLEDDYWVNPDILIKAKPIPINQKFSRIAHTQNIEQFIATSRGHELSNCTFESVEQHYPWIPPENVFIRDYEATDGDLFKALTVREIEPDIHFEDSIRSANEILRLSQTPIILFPRSLEAGVISDKSVIEFQDMEVWADWVEAYSINL